MQEKRRKGFKKTDAEILSSIRSYFNSTTGMDSHFLSRNAEFLRRYKGLPYGNERNGFSKVISPDVQQVVDSDLPSLARIFLGKNSVIQFEPAGPTDQDRLNAKAKSDYVHAQVNEQPWSYRVLSGFLQNALIHSYGVIHYYVEDETHTEQQVLADITQAQLDEFLALVEEQDPAVLKIEITNEEESTNDIDGEARFTFTYEIRRRRQKVRLDNINIEDFFISTEAEDKDSAPLVGKREFVTRATLLARGLNKETILDLPSSPQTPPIGNELVRLRHGSTQQTHNNSYGLQNSTPDIWDQLIEVLELYVMLDPRGDGHTQRYRVVLAGTQEILEIEPFDHVPFAIASAHLNANSVVGRSRAELVAPIALAKTALLRAIQDNSYASSNPRVIAGHGVDIDDLLVNRPGGIIRVKNLDGQSVSASVQAIQIPYTGQQQLQVSEHWDRMLAQSAGVQQQNQGLAPGQLDKVTATAFNGLQDAQFAKIELVARNISEGFQQLYEGVGWLNDTFEDTPGEILASGQPIEVDPKLWADPARAVSETAFDVGNDEQLLQSYQAILGIQQQLAATGSLMVDQEKIFNTLNRTIKGLGLPSVQEFFNNPETPDETLRAENEQLKLVVQQAQQAGGALEQLAQQQAQLAGQQQQLELLKLQVTSEGKQQQQALELKKQQDKHALDVAKMETQLLNERTKNQLERDKLESSNALTVREQDIKIREVELKHKQNIEVGDAEQ